MTEASTTGKYLVLEIRGDDAVLSVGEDGYFEWEVKAEGRGHQRAIWREFHRSVKRADAFLTKFLEEYDDSDLEDGPSR